MVWPSSIVTLEGRSIETGEDFVEEKGIEHILKEMAVFISSASCRSWILNRCLLNYTDMNFGANFSFMD